MAAPGYSRRFVWIASVVVFLVAGAASSYGTVLFAIFHAWGRNTVHERPFDRVAWQAAGWKETLIAESNYHTI